MDRRRKSIEESSLFNFTTPRQKKVIPKKKSPYQTHVENSVKELVAKDLETARANKVIGHSLNAKITLYADDEEYNFIKENLEILKTVFIISDLQIDKNLRKNEEKIGVKVDTAEGEKCERCWMYSTTVGEDKENPTICYRCSEVIKE